MCGRYTLHLSKDKLLKALAMDIPEDFEYEPDYNIAPGREILAMQGKRPCAHALGSAYPA